MMRGSRISANMVLLAVLAGLYGWSGTVIAQDRRSSRFEEDYSEDMEVLTRGPVHEAFCSTISFEPEPGIIAPSAPPDMIEEIPPDQRPAGRDVDWIPGYWAWDEESNDFLWVSGIWRFIPPGRQWISGYWARTNSGFQWIAGYWEDVDARECDYLPRPPAPLDAGPSIPRPSSNQIWLPGTWVWHEDRYAWRPGYWAAGRQDWDWIPAHYVWTPRGYIFVDGYWDCAVDRRGVLFAPIQFGKRFHSRKDHRFTPTVAINISIFTDHLFVRPQYHHYYFGDYYAPRYEDRGFFSVVSRHISRTIYEPVMVRRRWDHRREPDWDKRIESQYLHRRDHEDARPPRTWMAEKVIIKKGGRGRDGFDVTKSLVQLANRKHGAFRFQAVEPAERQSWSKRTEQIRRFVGERRDLESSGRGKSDERRSSKSEVSRGRNPKSPIVGRRSADYDKGSSPPKRHQTPKAESRGEGKRIEKRPK